jgi:hypothetical protein
MAKGKSSTNAEILRYALTHLEQERDAIQARINHINGQLGQKVSAPASSAAVAGPRKKRVLSASARKRIAAAQKKRWAEHRKAQAKAAKAE